jgi:hypothetical protein
MKGFGRKRLWPNRGNIPVFACRDWGKLWKPEDIEFRTVHLPNQSSQRYRCADSLNCRNCGPCTTSTLCYSAVIWTSGVSVSLSRDLWCHNVQTDSLPRVFLRVERIPIRSLSRSLVPGEGSGCRLYGYGCSGNSAPRNVWKWNSG